MSKSNPHAWKVLDKRNKREQQWKKSGWPLVEHPSERTHAQKRLELAREAAAVAETVGAEKGG